jgi:uncharacterized membrane protein
VPGGHRVFTRQRDKSGSSVTQKPDRTFLHTLGREAVKWLDEGIIGPEQKDRILGRYRGIAAAEEHGPGKLIAAISVMGAVLVGIGVLLFVASNWSTIPHEGKLAIIFVSLFASYGYGFFLRYERQTLPRTGAGIILLGSLIFGAGIFLIAQMYNITVHYPNGPLLWGLAVLPMAYLLDLNPLLSLAIIDLLIWLGMETTYALSFTRMYEGMTVFLALFLLAGITLWTVGLMHRGIASLARISGPYLGIGLFVAFLAGYVLTFDFARWSFGAPGLKDFYYGLSVLFALGLGIFLVKGEKGKAWLVETVFILALFLAVLFMSLTSRGFVDPSDMSYASGYSRTDQGYAAMRLGFNLLYAFQIIGVIVLGYFRQNRTYVNLGLVFFVLEMIARYFDFFWKLLPRSLFFMAGGLLLLASGVVLERKRRKVLASFGVEAG